MTDSFHASFRPLEFERLKNLLARYTSTGAARSLAAAIVPYGRLEALQAEHDLTAEAMAYLRTQRVPFTDVPLLDDSLEKAQVAQTSLEIEEIEAVQDFLAQAEGLRSRWKDDAEQFPRLARQAARLPDLRELRKRLGSAIRNGEVEEKYSPALGRIRRAIESARARVVRRLESMVRSPEYSTQLQDQLVTVRNGRFVIPVRSEQKRSFDGIVHGTSSSGATVFMEPLDALEMNNELVRLQEEERHEILRILAELTGWIQESSSALRTARTVCSQLELVFAKARFGREFDCVKPEFSAEPVLSLKDARHPLLEDRLRGENAKVVPVSLDLDASRRILVISGPNAGGKTVVLKTAGLLALMAQSGIPVPAERARFSLYDRVLADIGDQQSIADHLSTFSAHVLSIKAMLESATAHSLILLDEIGSSTEPGEGAALARAVLDRFRRIGALAIATTHYNRLKIYAETTPGVANSAMEFNELTFEPSYRLLHGVAGASSGLKIAERLQMPAEVMAAAASFLESGELELARYAEELQRRIEQAEAQAAQLATERRQFEEWRERELEQIRTRQTADIARTEKQLDRIVREMSERASRQIEALIRELEGESVKRKLKQKLETAKFEAGAQLRAEKEKLAARPEPDAPASAAAKPGEPVTVGAKVRIRSLDVIGVVASVAGPEAEILSGAMRMRRPLADLEVVAGRTLPPGVQLNVAVREMASNEINLLGCTVDEALERADKFLDEAFLAQMPQVRIVHGSGTGALRNAIAHLLERHPHVARFEPATQSTGGRGVTIATLRD